MSLPVSFTLANFAEGYCWSGPQQYATDLIALLTGTVPSGSGVVISMDPPAVEDQDKVWVRLDSNGYLEGIYTFLGEWLRPHPIPPSSEQVIIWKGTEADLWAYDGGDGDDPGSTAPTATTGAMWQRDTDFDFRFPVGIGTNPTSYGSDPATVIGVGDTGGEEKHALTEPEMPPHVHDITAVTPIADKWSGSAAGAGKIATGDDALNAGDDTLITNAEPHFEAANAGGTGAPGAEVVTEHNTMPPYYGVIFAKRTARKFYKPV